MFNLNFKFIRYIFKNIFPFYRNKELRHIFELLQEGSSKKVVVARFVGGCVRKHLSGEKIDDIDIATILTTDQIKEKLKNENLKIVDTGTKHGTITLISKNFKLEITTLRKDIETDGRHAKVEYTDDWEQDSERRDFTINAIYLDINGKVFDPQMGTIDLKNNNVKFIGDPQKRIEEDYLRIIRFIRFRIMYGVKVETSTENVIKQNLDGIKKISKERILLELFKILDLKNFLNINDSINLKEIFNLIFPEFLYLNRLAKLKKVNNFSQIQRNIILAVLLIDEEDNHEYFTHKYNVPIKIKENLKKIASDIKNIKKNKDFFEKNILKNIYINGKDHLVALNLIYFSINPKVKLKDFSYNLKKILKSNIPEFKINGKYLKKFGMEEGESMGKVLREIEDEWIRNNFKISNDKIEELIKVNSN